MASSPLSGKRSSSIMILMFCLSCGFHSADKARTAKEFVSNYSEAYRSENVAAIMSMTEFSDDKARRAYREDLVKSIERRGFGYNAWVNTQYLSEEDKGDYIRVEVMVSGVKSSIVLKKRKETLIMVLNPSEYP